MRFLAFAFITAFAALPAPAATFTVTFDEEFLDDLGDAALMRSQGFEFQTSFLYSDFDDVTLHDDFGGILESRISRGSAFTPVSIDLTGYSNIYRTGDNPVPDSEEDSGTFDAWVKAGKAAAPVLRLTGLFDSAPAVSAVLLGPLETLTTYVFGPEFAGITELVLSVELPDELPVDEWGYPLHVTDILELTSAGQLWCEEYCAEFRADNLVVEGTAPAPVPLPAGGIALLSALALLGAARRVRR